MQEVFVPILKRDVCFDAYENNQMGTNPVHESNICTGPLNGAASACKVTIW